MSLNRIHDLLRRASVQASVVWTSSQGPIVVTRETAGFLHDSYGIPFLGEKMVREEKWTHDAAANQAALLAGPVTAFCGPITFLGILVPQACRLLLSTADHRVPMPALTIGAAALALGADLVPHLPWSRHLLYVNAVTGAGGGPIVLWMLLRRRLRWT